MMVDAVGQLEQGLFWGIGFAIAGSIFAAALAMANNYGVFSPPSSGSTWAFR